jgi:TolB protein
MTDDLHPPDLLSPAESARQAALLARVKSRGTHLRRRRRVLLTMSGLGAAFVVSVVVLVAALLIPNAGTDTGKGRAENHQVPATVSPSVHAVLLSRGVQAPVDSIPWAQVGPGWTLATWDEDPAVPPGGVLPAGAVPPAQDTTTLFLVNPIGGRYAIKTFPPGVQVGLADWSADGRRALLTFAGSAPTSELVTEIDLSTGDTVNSFTLATGATLSYSRPDGLAILSWTDATGSPILDRLNRQGATELVYPSTFTQVGPLQSGFLPSPDGTRIVLGASKGLALVANDGTVIRQLPTSGACDPQKWWTAAVVLASCTQAPTSPDGATTRLWLVPISGATPTPFESANPDPQTDLGDLDAWSLGRSTFVQATGACGLAYVAQLHPDGTTSKVTVPGTNNGASQFIRGTYGDLLAIQAEIPCGPGETLVWFNPADHTSNLILGPPLNGGGVIDALVYPDPDS